MIKRVLFVLILSSVAVTGFANESIVEKLASAARSEGRQMERGSHRMQEMLCADGALQCAAKKAANRMKEVGAAASDGIVEIKNKID